MGKFSREQYEVTQYLANLVGRNKQNKFMQSISCMSLEWRQIQSFIEIAKKIQVREGITKEEEEEINFIKEMIELLGQADWSMDIISHLAMKAGRIERGGGDGRL